MEPMMKADEDRTAETFRDHQPGRCMSFEEALETSLEDSAELLDRLKNEWAH